MGKAEERVSAYISSNPPLGCRAGLTCEFSGTAAALQNERQVFIQACSAATRGGFLGPSDKTRTNACQAAFDQATAGVRFDDYSEAVEEKAFVISNIGKDSPVIYLVGFLFVGLIIYLLMS